MLMVISPAKTLDFESRPATQRFTQPQYLDHSQELIEQLRHLSPAQISELMHVSDKIGGLNAARFGSWTPAFTAANAKQALLAFKGDVYTGLNAEQVQLLREKHSVYMVGSGRANMAGVDGTRLSLLAKAIAQVCTH